MVLQIEEGPQHAFDGLGFQFLVHGVDDLIAEDEAVVFGYCFLGGVLVVGEQDELLQQLHAPTLALELEVGQQTG